MNVIRSSTYGYFNTRLKPKIIFTILRIINCFIIFGETPRNTIEYISPNDMTELGRFTRVIRISDTHYYFRIRDIFIKLYRLECDVSAEKDLIVTISFSVKWSFGRVLNASDVFSLIFKLSRPMKRIPLPLFA